MAAKEKEGELTLQDVYGLPHPITASVYHAMLGLGWLAFILSIVCNLLFYAVHPAQVQMGDILDKIPKIPWKKRDKENPLMEEGKRYKQKNDENKMKTDQNEVKIDNEKKMMEDNSEEEKEGERCSIETERKKGWKM